jgi:uncharacterized protein (TIGR00661 family)
MAKIFYSMCGEGRGHAARVRSMVEHLKGEHQLVLFAPDQAYDFLAPRYPAGTPNVEVRRIPGLRFFYTNGRLDLIRSISNAFGYMWKLRNLVRQLKRAIREEQPDLILSDFEPALPRAAKSCKAPFVSLNHQHFLVACDLSSLPWHLRGWASMMGLAVRAHHYWQRQTIVSSFFSAPLRPGYERVLQVGPLLRPEVLQARPVTGDHIVSYLRASTPPKVLEMLHSSGREVRVYGLGNRKDEGNLRFMPLHEQKFVDDVASCHALVGAAGNQSLGEAIYMGKPIFALPEADHHEQMINSHFLGQMGTGAFSTLEDVQPREFSEFLGKTDQYRDALRDYAGRIDGTPAAVGEVVRHLRGRLVSPIPMQNLCLV